MDNKKLVEELRRLADLTPPICNQDRPEEHEFFGKKITVYCKPFEQFQDTLRRAADRIEELERQKPERLTMENDLISRSAPWAVLGNIVTSEEVEVAIANAPAVDGVTFAKGTDAACKWKPASEPPEVWRDKNGTLVNYLVYMPEYGVDVGNYMEPAKTWLCMGIPCKVTHWMPMPEPPDTACTHLSVSLEADS